jgi:hypothetical protein
VNPKAVSGSGAMSDIVEAMDIDGQLYVSGHNLPQFLERAMERGAEIERARIVLWLRNDVATVISDLISIQIEECEHLKEKGE